MADQVPTEGFSVPPAGDGSSPVHQRGAHLPPSNMQPGYVPPANPASAGAFTQADLDRAVADALAKQQNPSASAAPSATPAAPLGNPAASLDIADAAASDTLLSSLTSTFSALGKDVDINRAIGNALSLGKPELIDNAYLTEKGGAHAEQLKAVAAAIVGRVQEQTRNAEQAVYAAAGDKATWDAAVAVFNQKAPQHVKLVVAKLLESGNPESIKAGAQTAIDYARSNGLVPQAAGVVAGGAGLAVGHALSKEQFQAEMFKLDKNARDYNTKRAALFAGRAAGKQRGI